MTCPLPPCPQCDRRLRRDATLNNGWAVLRCKYCDLIWYGRWRGAWTLVIWPEEA